MLRIFNVSCTNCFVFLLLTMEFLVTGGTDSFDKYRVTYESHLLTLPEFEKAYARSLSDQEKFRLFSSILDRSVLIEANEMSRKFTRTLVEAIALKAYQTFNELFFELSTHHAKTLARESIIQNESSGTKLTYGEIEFFSFLAILDKIGPKKGDTFVDLGHGTGTFHRCNFHVLNHFLLIYICKLHWILFWTSDMAQDEPSVLLLCFMEIYLKKLLESKSFRN